MGSKGVNLVIVLGNLGGNPEVRYMPNGGAVARFTVATSETWRDKTTGEQREKTEWHRIAVYGKLAEIAGDYLRKGSQVYIKGKMQTHKWQDQDGIDRYTTEIVVQGFDGVMQMLGHANTSTPPLQQASQPQYNEPPIDFDDDPNQWGR